MSLDWLALLESPSWKALAKVYREDLEDLTAQLLAVALESSDPRVRGVAWKIRAIEDVLARPERELEINRERQGEDEV